MQWQPLVTRCSLQSQDQGKQVVALTVDAKQHDKSSTVDGWLSLGVQIKYSLKYGR